MLSFKMDRGSLSSSFQRIPLVGTLWQARNLLLNLVRRDLTVRYRSTVLGFFWSFAKPLAYMGIYYLIFTKIIAVELRQQEIPYALHVLAGILLWTFFTGAISEAMYSILNSANMVKKVKLPLEVFPTAAVCSHAVHFALAMIVVVPVMLLFGLVPGPLFLLLPALAALQFILILGVAFLLSALNVFYRDVASIWEVVSVAWFYATPIIYPAYYATEYFEQHNWGWMTWLYLANPMAPITIGYRRLMLYGSIPSGAEKQLELQSAQLLGSLAMAVALSVILLWISWRIFSILSRHFADQL
ncbi:ABC transporter permease [Candidatus Sumerlaeota bacterium]|nr:ABC transporter permease [Candidatus Sumerlaeota bacterium]